MFREYNRLQETEGIRTRIIAGDILISITADVGMVALVPTDIEESPACESS